jgi:1,4-alpha-glucan branching enzyme
MLNNTSNNSTHYFIHSNLFSMKHFIIQILALLLIIHPLTNNLFSQVITTDPPFPTADEPVTIIFDATQGNGGLVNVPPPIYAHTGVITDLSTSPSDWRYVIALWHQNIPKALMTPMGNNIYHLDITPSIRSFYNVPLSEQILEMAFVFRNADGSKAGRDINDSDIFAPVYIPGINVSISLPANGTIIELGAIVEISASANQADSMFLYLNSVLLHKVAGNNITSEVVADEPGSQWIKAIAKHGGEYISDSVYFFARGPVNMAALPDGVINGINYINEHTVTLVLHDPPALKQFVFVIGDFNNWLVTDDTYMNRTPSGEHFWVTLTGLEAGKEYGFQYYIDSELRIADPYTEKVLDPWHDDEIISQGRYPGLIPYPKGKTEHPVSVLQTAREPYEWQNTNFVPPAVEDLVIYELLIRDFLENSTYQQLKDTLAYLKWLGVNAIELLPITNFEGNLSWGYNPSFFFAPDKFYGPRRKLKKFIDEAHGMGIAVILDMVWNHSFGQSPLLRMYPNVSINPWYSPPIFHNTDMNFGSKFDHGSPHFIEFMDRANRHWLEEYRVDGFRFDLTKGFTTQYKGPDDEWGSAYDQERVNNLKRLHDHLKSINPNTYVILEHLADNSEETVLAEYGMLLWGNLNYNYNEATMGYHDGGKSNFSWISYKNRGWSFPHVVGYMESHDEERLMFKNVTWGNSGNPAHNVTDTTIALQRIATAAAFFFTIPGPKMIWQFGELGYDYSINYCPHDGSLNPGCRTDPKPVRWDYFEDARRNQLFHVFSDLIKMKQNYDVFRTDDFNLSLAGAMKRIKLNHASMNVVVLGNFGIQTDDISAQFQHTGWWYEHFSGDSINVTDVNMSIQLNPAEYRLYSTQKIVGTGDIQTPGTSHRLLIKPNPVKDHFTVEFTLPANDFISLDVYNIQGRKMATIGQGNYGRGTHSISYTLPNDLASGVYLLRLVSGQQVITQKFVVP